MMIYYYEYVSVLVNVTRDVLKIGERQTWISEKIFHNAEYIGSTYKMEL